ncbi:hypothetical protein T4A_11976 [Trichinella pseudospiralis]|uniref:Uncharacterized protein n=1 Tax=Trichinella pseudospiralis TaxID=6337 RepID=A0A0V1DMG3_TRIPS|nr:hypothetical protein T4A_11976 [Trichinella pseudospiralis]
MTGLKSMVGGDAGWMRRYKGGWLQKRESRKEELFRQVVKIERTLVTANAA